jgi:hypothetical protein
MANPNDIIRDSILRHLYKLHQKARGISSVGTGIRDLWSAMKKLGYNQAEVNSNLDYLIQKEWAREVVQKRKFTTPRGTTQETETKTYKISDIGIDLLQGASAFRREETFSRINVTNINGVTVIGEGNVVNTQYTDLSRWLSDLEKAVAESAKLENEQKLDVLADISTIQSQLSKPKLNTGLIKSIWQGLEANVTAAGFGELVYKIAEFVSHLPS